jgi:hypothetical protein
MVSKTIVAQVTLGSNPSPSATASRSDTCSDRDVPRQLPFANDAAARLSNSNATNGSLPVTHASWPGSMT